MVWGGKTKPHSDAQEDAWWKILAYLQHHLYWTPRARTWRPTRCLSTPKCTSSPAVTVTSLPILNPPWSVKDWKGLRHIVNLESTWCHANLLQSIWRLFYLDTSVKLTLETIWVSFSFIFLSSATELFYVHLKLNTGFYIYLHCMRVIMFVIMIVYVFLEQLFVC